MNNSKHSQMTFQELADKLDQFDIDRRWIDLEPSDLAKSIILEAAELLEHFQWDETLKNREGKTLERNIDEIKHEVADVFIYLMKFCREMDIDIVDATMKKVEKIGNKYPVGYNGGGVGHGQYLKIKKEYRAEK